MQLTVTLEYMRSTKRTHLYKGESPAGGEIGFYLPKADWDDTTPERITLTVEG